MIDPRGPVSGTSENGYRRMVKGFCRGSNTPEFFEELKGKVIETFDKMLLDSGI